MSALAYDAGAVERMLDILGQSADGADLLNWLASMLGDQVSEALAHGAVREADELAILQAAVQHAERVTGR